MKALTIFETALNAILPLVLLMGLGYWLRRKELFGDGFLTQGSKLIFRVLLPCMLFANVYDMEGFGAIPWDIVAFAIGISLVLCLLGMGLALAVTRVPERRGVVAQSAFRSNVAIVGLALASALGGQEATAVASIISAFTIALFNMLAVIVLTVFLKDGAKIRPGKVLMDILRNPPITGILLGFGCLALRWGQTALWGRCLFSLEGDAPFLYRVVCDLRSITSPFALLVLGGQFRFSAVGQLRRELVAGATFRLVLAPVLGLSAAVLLGHAGFIQVGPQDYPALIALLGSPVAVGSETMAAQMGNDGQLATQLVVWTNLLSIVTLFCAVSAMMALGLLGNI